ncbi:MAG: cytochrome b [Endozoicomonas sp. (ex Botrylloides leachii)]|nr:cytochrome b [Endozoicomonas sp. (ex Botrylloides leachii)]
MIIWKNTPKNYGLVSIFMHWISALTVFSLFGVGLYMVSLSYYDPLYQTLPFWHKSIGLSLLTLTLARLVWKAFNPAPKPLPTHSKTITMLALFGHYSLYLLMLMTMFSGYLISTADGRPISFFGWFDIPALITGIAKQEDFAGLVHFCLAWTLVILAVSHGLAAIKHHVIDKDQTLKRMLTSKQHK